MNIQVNDLAPLNHTALDSVSAAVALTDAIDNANEIISLLLLHNCSGSIGGRLDALAREMKTIERSATHFTNHV